MGAGCGQAQPAAHSHGPTNPAWAQTHQRGKKRLSGGTPLLLEYLQPRAGLVGKRELFTNEQPTNWRVV